MLTLKCSRCRTKLWRYFKRGPGEVLRCHKDRITKSYQFHTRGQKIICSCGNIVAIDKGSYYKMVAKGFTYSGTKETKR